MLERLLYWHPRTLSQIERLGANLPHALLVTGQQGSGVTTAAETLATGADNAAVVSRVAAETDGAISIETVRSLYGKTRANLVGKHLIILDEADRMTQEAQNALLKLLEEPSGQTTFILTSHRPGALAAPVVSRCQQLYVRPLRYAQAQDMLAELGITQAELKRRILILADGLAGELAKLAQDEDYRQRQFERAALAKQLLGGSRLNRLLAAYKLGADRQAALSVLSLAARLLKTSLSSGQPEAINRLELLLDSCDRLQKNALVKLQLLRAAL